MKFYSATKKNENLSFEGKWMELENILSEVIQVQKAITACSSSYADFRPKTNAAILWNMGHIKGRPHMGRIGQGMETKKLECG
jgi:hypothetical protein